MGSARSPTSLRHRPVHRLWQLGAYAVSQAVELGTERGGKPRTQHGEPVLDQSQLGPPLRGIYGEHSLQRLGRQVQAVDIERAGRRYGPDRRHDGLRPTLQTLDDPLEHPAVLTESRPEEVPGG